MSAQQAWIPAALTSRGQWVVWRYEVVADRPDPTKVPYQARRPGRRASSTAPATWAGFNEAAAVLAAGRADGIGFVFSKDDDLVGVDLDRVRDCATGAVQEWAARVVNRLDSYTELSPSGTGLHVIARGVLSACGKRDQVEMYDRARYFTVTGRILPGSLATVEPRQAELEATHRQYLARPASTDRPALSTRGLAGQPVSEDDDELLTVARRARNGAAFAALYDHGDTSAFDGDDSRADLALCGQLRYWSGGDREAVDRLFRASALMRHKWDSKRGASTYGERTLDKAMAGSVYVPPATVEQRTWSGYGDGSRWGLGALRRTLEMLRDTPAERLTRTAEAAALSIGQVVGGGHLAREIAERTLSTAIDPLGAHGRQAVLSGLEAGMRSPRGPRGVR